MRTRPGAFAAGATLLLGLVKLASGSPSIDGLISSGGYLSRLPGGGDGQLGNAPAAVPDAVWWALDAACLAAGAMLAAFLAVRALGAVATLRRRRVESLSPAQWVLGAFAAGVLAILAIRMATGGEFYERYLLPAVPPLLVLLLTAAPTDAPRRAARSGGIAAVGALAALGLVLFAQTDSLKAGLWHAGQRLETAGFDARDVDAGFEWDGYHYRGIVSRPVPTRWRDPIGQYGRVFHRTGNCVAVAAAPVSETWMQPIAVERYTTLLGLRKRTLWLYRNAHACGPGSPSLAAARSALAPR